MQKHKIGHSIKSKFQMLITKILQIHLHTNIELNGLSLSLCMYIFFLSCINNFTKRSSKIKVFDVVDSGCSALCLYVKFKSLKSKTWIHFSFFPALQSF